MYIYILIENKLNSELLGYLVVEIHNIVAVGRRVYLLSFRILVRSQLFARAKMRHYLLAKLVSHLVKVGVI